MNSRIFNVGNPLYTENTTLNIAPEEATDEDKRFANVLERFDAAQETREEREQRLKSEDANALEQKKRNQKIAALQGLISELRAKLAGSGGKDPGIEARLSAAQTELYWLMFSF